jgi:hypothetical protein
MPEGTVYVGRPSPWGNKWRIHDDLGRWLLWDAQTVVDLYRIDVEHMEDFCGGDREAFLAPLRGRDLACWCKLDQPCHADVLLELANR